LRPAPSDDGVRRQVKASRGGRQRCPSALRLGVRLSRSQGFANTPSGDVAPATLLKVSVSRKSDQPKTKNSPGLLAALEPSAPPPLYSHSTVCPLTTQVPFRYGGWAPALTGADASGEVQPVERSHARAQPTTEDDPLLLSSGPAGFLGASAKTTGGNTPPRLMPRLRSHLLKW